MCTIISSADRTTMAVWLSRRPPLENCRHLIWIIPNTREFIISYEREHPSHLIRRPFFKAANMPPRNDVFQTIATEDDTGSASSPEEAAIPNDADYHAPEKRTYTIVWRNVILMGLLHIASVYAVFLFPVCKWQTLLFAFILYYFGATGITAGAHRLWAHRTYKATFPLRLFLAFIQTLAFQNDIYEWARDHRVHHKYSETDADPHNAKRGFFFSHVGWLLVRKHPDVIRKGRNIDLSDLKADPIVRIQRKIYKPAVILVCFILPTVVPWYWGETTWNAFYVCGLMRYAFTLHVTWCVNSLAHMFGNKPYDRFINPTENSFVVVTALGEGFHNYHHTFPGDYATSEFGFERLNSTKLFIDICCFLGLAYDRKQTSADVVRKRKIRTGDGSL
ncbi:acyl-CoA desaturase-like [Ptychodera flava]|uniref:acyl-CoA desaturase-like n=1 Tax=Ptychodera flava TaxID=63121 RepID=UPI00396A20BE